MNIYRDFLERTAWTSIAAAGSSLIMAGVLDQSAGKAAAAVALTTAINALTIFARWRASVLPNPGEGLPKLPTGN